MAAGLPDLVDCDRLAGESASLERVYPLGALPRLHDVLAEPTGSLRASFAFSTLESGAPGARVSFEATPRLECQRCLQAFDLPVSGASDIEFATSDDPADSGSELECFKMTDGHVSLRDVAEEELLLALPLAPACASPRTCGRMPAALGGEPRGGLPRGDGPPAQEAGEPAMRRPFSGLKDLLKKT